MGISAATCACNASLCGKDYHSTEPGNDFLEPQKPQLSKIDDYGLQDDIDADLASMGPAGQSSSHSSLPKLLLGSTDDYLRIVACERSTPQGGTADEQQFHRYDSLERTSPTDIGSSCELAVHGDVGLERTPKTDMGSSYDLAVNGAVCLERTSPRDKRGSCDLAVKGASFREHLPTTPQPTGSDGEMVTVKKGLEEPSINPVHVASAEANIAAPDEQFRIEACMKAGANRPEAHVSTQWSHARDADGLHHISDYIPDEQEEEERYQSYFNVHMTENTRTRAETAPPDMIPPQQPREIQGPARARVASGQVGLSRPKSNRGRTGSNGQQCNQVDELLLW
eukprot:TRINITY_DN42037_c0_g1_i1.p1 TRINITY_DN42037_c0_g1~~TRINITY_DN42037_c0_g1_i1.p1  ORF type:complete len:339 (-),score=46.11 TRINITY_DN42037_c0_g1_i1:121-1137(-)